jgi:hypothetical protein
VHSHVVHDELHQVEHRLREIRCELLNLAELMNQAISRERSYGPRSRAT